MILRQKAADYVADNENTTGAERGNIRQQGFGVLAEIVVRKYLKMPLINPEDHPLGYDVLLKTGVKIDVKCRGGDRPFQEEYVGNDNIPREAKHNLWARQINDSKLDTDIYLMTHLETPKVGELPGTNRQRKWKLYICGWVSKKRAGREGVYVPRGSLTERGNSWFQYRGQEIEFYNRNLNGLKEIKDLLNIESKDVEKDQKHDGSLNLTSVDAIRITYDLIGRGILLQKHLKAVQKEIGLNKIVKPILNSNQYFHLMRWLEIRGIISDVEIKKAQENLQEEPYDGI
jgi:hypothetical protein